MSAHGARALSALRRTLAVARKEVRQLARDQLTMGFVVGVPIVQLLLFGYAIDQDVRRVPTAAVNLSPSAVSRRLLGQLEATQTFRVTQRVATEEQARRLLQRGKVRAVVVVPPDFTRAYYRGRGAELALLVDATDPLVARAARAAAEGLVQGLNARVQPFTVAGQTSLRAPRDRDTFAAKPELIHPGLLSVSVLNYHNPELRTALFVVPGLLGVILTTTMILMTSVALVRERERGTFEFLIGTPVGRSELMLGKILPYIAIGLVQIALVLLTGLVLFRVPVQGSLLDLALSSLLFIAANLTLGLVISTACTSQLQATQVSFFFFLPSVLLSGFMFPFETMPRPAQWLGELLPLTHYIRIVRGLLLRGTGLGDALYDQAALLAFFLAGLVAATSLFRKRLD